MAILLLAGTAGAKEKAPKPAVPPQGVELLFPAGMGKQAKGAKLSKEQKKAAALLQKLKAIEKGGNVNAVDKHRQTALMHAAAQGNRLAVCWLVAKGANAAIKSKKGKAAGDLVKEENAGLKELLKACCEEKLPLPEEEKRLFKSAEEAQKALENPGGTWMSAIAMPLRAGAHADRLHLEIYYRYPEENLAFLLRHGMPVASFNMINWESSTPPHLRLLLACGMSKECDDTRKKLIFALLLDDVPGIEACLQQEPSLAKEAKYYGRAQSAAAVQALLKAAGEVPDGAACLKEVLATSYNGAAVKALLDAGAPVPTDEGTLRMLLPFMGYACPSDAYTTYIGELYGKPDVVQAMLDAGLDPNYTFSDGDSLLHYASATGNLAIVQALLKKGANANVLNKDNDTPLSLIFANKPEEGYTANEGAIVQALLKAGAKLDLGELSRKLEFAVSNNGFVSPRSKKEQDEFIAGLKAVLQAGFKVPANILLYCGNPDMPDARWEEVALLLLEHGADPKAMRDDGTTTLMRAGCLGPRIAQKILDAGVDPNAVTKNGDSALKNALTGNHAEVAKLLHDKGVRYSGELLICHPDCMQIMLDDGAKIPATIYKDLLEHGGNHALTKEQYAQIISFLKKAGAAPTEVSFLNFENGPSCNQVAKSAFINSFQDPKVQDKDGSTLLFLAEGSDIGKLIRAGVDPLSANKDGRTPLFRRLSLEDIQTFTRHGVNVNTQDNQGNTALIYLLREWNIDENLKALLKVGADPNITNNEGNNALMTLTKNLNASFSTAQILLDAGTNPNTKNKNGKTALQLLRDVKKSGCWSNHLEKIQNFLQEHGAQPSKSDLDDARDDQERTKLMRTLADPKASLDSVKQLIDDGADVNAQDKEGKTPLMYARNAEQIKLLLEKGADAKHLDKNGSSVLLLMVIERDDPESVKLLLDAGTDPAAVNKWKRTAHFLAIEYKREQTLKIFAERGITQ